MKKGIVDVKEFACYITDYYYNKYSKNISPIKLHKALYFCFAYWGSYVRKSFMKETEITIDKSDWLFNEDIEAWVYGPVVPDVLRETNIKEYNNENIFAENEDVKDYINGILVVPDFKLIEVSYADNCWKSNFDINSDKHDNVIDKEEIILEYSKKY